MQKVFSLREKLNSLIDRRSQIMRILGKFLIMILTLVSLSNIFGASDTMQGKHVAIIAAIACSFIPFAYIYPVFILLCMYYLSTYTIDVSLLFLFGVILFYGVYNRNFTKYGYIALLTFILLPTPLSAMIPLYVGINCGVLGIAPMLAGIVIYYFLTSLNGAMKAFELASTGTAMYQCIIDTMVENKEMVVCLVVMTVIAVLARQISRMRFNYSWYLSVPIAAIVYAVLYMYGCFFFELSSNIWNVIITMIISSAVMELLQFYRVVLDYSRSEILEFEDDEYFYYVKAVPKVKVSEENVNVKTIARQQKGLIRFRERNKE
ncbi:MAG: hypothetical protein MJ087_03330 [Lachnospiraceae bacterium]|nr:hypothetical protein [Lachnospiraceae bacterium]